MGEQLREAQEREGSRVAVCASFLQRGPEPTPFTHLEFPNFVS